MQIRRWSTLTALLVMGLSASWAQSPPSATLTVTISGTPGPVLSGTDPMQLSGKAIVLTITASESLSPVAHEAHAASYEVPAGAVSFTEDDETITTTMPSKVGVVLTPTADIAGLSAMIGIDPVVGTIYLAPGSWKQTVLSHPRAFSPSPQDLTPATSATGPGSKIQYTFENITTILGLTGTASSSNQARLRP